MFSLLLALMGTVTAAVVDRVAAVVDDEVITLSEVYELGRTFIDERTSQGEGTAAQRRAAELEVLDSIIRRRMITQYLQQIEMDVNDEHIERAIDDVARRHGVERTDLRAEVERSGVTWGTYREEIRASLREQSFGQMIRSRVVENEDQIRDAYGRMQAGADLPLVVELGAIYLAYAAVEAKEAALQKAEMIRARVISGESFGALSAEFDNGPYGAKDGAMGSYSEGELVDVLNGPAFSVEVGAVSAPVITEQGVFLLEVRGREKQPLRPYEEVRDEIAARIYEGQIEREKDTWYQQRRRTASVEIHLEEVTEQ
jgi:peptidyl-prolyl cis-trans isomerase SurA